jgi:ABC-type multidrug transport system ATPase subunit
MHLSLDNAGKRFRLEWIFRGLTLHIPSGTRCAVLGPNGSGKSTLMKVLSGHLSLSKGSILYHFHNTAIEPDAVYRSMAYAAPYIELIEELTLEEAVRFHSRLKPLLTGYDVARVLETLALPRARHKEIRFFSSGMKQRVKLALALCSDTPVVLLDEPATNLDVQGIDWYQRLIESLAGNRTVIIASNDPHDAEFCPEHVQILDYKNSR